MRISDWSSDVCSSDLERWLRRKYERSTIEHYRAREHSSRIAKRQQAVRGLYERNISAPIALDKKTPACFNNFGLLWRGQCFDLLRVAMTMEQRSDDDASVLAKAINF